LARNGQRHIWKRYGGGDVRLASAPAVSVTLRSAAMPSVISTQPK
jgi:hypothetical protein